MSPASSGDKVVDVALAEFAALRAELMQNLTAKYSLIGLNITGVAALGGIVIANDADPRLLLIAPFLSGATGLLFHTVIVDIMVIASYIEQVQRPVLVERLGDDRIFSYESFFRSKTKLRPLVQALTLGLLFPGISLTTLVIVASSLRSFADWAMWSLGILLLIVQCTIWLSRFGLPSRWMEGSRRRHTRRSPEP